MADWQNAARQWRERLRRSARECIAPRTTVLKRWYADRTPAWLRNKTFARYASSAGAALVVGAGLWIAAFVGAYWLLYPMPEPCTGPRVCVLVMGLEGETFTAQQTHRIRDALKASPLDVKIVPGGLFRPLWGDTARARLEALVQRRLAALHGDVLIAGTVAGRRLQLTVIPASGDTHEEEVTLPRDFDAAAGLELTASTAVVAGAHDLTTTLTKQLAELPTSRDAAARALLFQSYGLSLAATGALERAIWALREAARANEGDERDKTQTDLDLARLLVRDGRPGRLKEAIDLFGKVLTETERHLDWGGIRTELGVALLKLGGQEEGTAHLRQAENELWLALKAQPRGPLAWAATEKAYGDALAAAGAREPGTRRLVQAVAAYRAALQEGTRARGTRLWGETMVALGDALARLGEHEASAQHLEEAAAVYRAVLRAQADQAAALNGLGNVLMRLGGDARAQEAIDAYREALQTWTRENAPLDWAMVENNLGIALARLGQREAGTEKLEEAVAAYREALQECTRERVPLLWAATQNNLASALQYLGERTNRPEDLEAAIAASEEALKERTRERTPLAWAISQNNLGNALMSLGKRRYSYWRLKAAVEAYRAALQVLTPGSGSYYEIAAQNLSIAEALLYQLSTGKAPQ